MYQRHRLTSPTCQGGLIYKQYSNLMYGATEDARHYQKPHNCTISNKSHNPQSKNSHSTSAVSQSMRVNWLRHKLPIVPTASLVSKASANCDKPRSSIIFCRLQRITVLRVRCARLFLGINNISVMLHHLNHHIA